MATAQAEVIAKAKYDRKTPFRASELWESSKQQVEIAAEAEAEAEKDARGEADAIPAKREAEAEGVQKVLEAKAQGTATISSASGDPKAAATLLMVERQRPWHCLRLRQSATRRQVKYGLLKR